jgi:hypothetical protein
MRSAGQLQHAAAARPDVSVAALAARTEGWAAGLQLAALLEEAERALASSVTGWREIGQLTHTAWGYYSLALLRGTPPRASRCAASSPAPRRLPRFPGVRLSFSQMTYLA